MGHRGRPALRALPPPSAALPPLLPALRAGFAEPPPAPPVPRCSVLDSGGSWVIGIGGAMGCITVACPNTCENPANDGSAADTAGTTEEAAEVLLEPGARDIKADMDTPVATCGAKLEEMSFMRSSSCMSPPSWKLPSSSSSWTVVACTLARLTFQTGRPGIKTPEQPSPKSVKVCPKPFVRQSPYAWEKLGAHLAF